MLHAAETWAMKADTLNCLRRNRGSSVGSVSALQAAVRDRSSHSFVENIFPLPLIQEEQVRDRSLHSFVENIFPLSLIQEEQVVSYL